MCFSIYSTDSIIFRIFVLGSDSMKNQTDIIASQNYLVTLQGLVERFSAFNSVFEQYFDTYRNICRGKCSVSENLPDLKINFESNVVKFKQIMTTVETLQAPAEYQYINRAFISIIKSYLTTLNQLTSLLDSDTPSNRSEIKNYHLQLKQQRSNVNQLLFNMY